MSLILFGCFFALPVFEAGRHYESPRDALRQTVVMALPDRNVADDVTQESQMETPRGKNESEHQPGSSAEQSPPQSAIISPAQPAQSENATHPSRNEVKERCSRDKRWRHSQVIVNAILAVVGICAAIIYYGQLRQMQKATRAATANVKLARESAHLDQRAWVSTFQVAKNGMPEIGKEFRIEIPIKNTGRTFAREVAI